MKKTVSISGMTCGHCVKRVENALGELSGITSVVVNLAEKNAIIEVDENTSDALIRQTIDDIGYTVEAIN